MVVDECYDDQYSLELSRTKVFRCINCGRIVDPVILYHEQHDPPKPQRKH